jgi:hypothetical protein
MTDFVSATAFDAVTQGTVPDWLAACVALETCRSHARSRCAVGIAATRSGCQAPEPWTTEPSFWTALFTVRAPFPRRRAAKLFSVARSITTGIVTARGFHRATIRSAFLSHRANTRRTIRDLLSRTCHWLGSRRRPPGRVDGATPGSGSCTSNNYQHGFQHGASALSRCERSRDRIETRIVQLGSWFFFSRCTNGCASQA